MLSHRTIERSVWVLIFGSLLLMGWGFGVEPADAGLARLMHILGLVALGLGVALILVRARMGQAR